jgi:hypothetical protein
MGNGLWEGCLPNAPHHNCQPLALERSRRTTIVIDDKLMKETLRLTGLSDRSGAQFENPAENLR